MGDNNNNLESRTGNPILSANAAATQQKGDFFFNQPNTKPAVGCFWTNWPDDLNYKKTHTKKKIIENPGYIANIASKHGLSHLSGFLPMIFLSIYIFISAVILSCEQTYLHLHILGSSNKKKKHTFIHHPFLNLQATTWNFFCTENSNCKKGSPPMSIMFIYPKKCTIAKKIGKRRNLG